MVPVVYFRGSKDLLTHKHSHGRFSKKISLHSIRGSFSFSIYVLTTCIESFLARCHSSPYGLAISDLFGSLWNFGPLLPQCFCLFLVLQVLPAMHNYHQTLRLGSSTKSFKDTLSGFLGQISFCFCRFLLKLMKYPSNCA